MPQNVPDVMSNRSEKSNSQNLSQLGSDEEDYYKRRSDSNSPREILQPTL